MLLHFITFIVTLLIIDSVWIFGASKFHKSTVEAVQRSSLEINPIAAGLFYLIASLGYVFFVRKLAKTPTDAFLYGALLGLVMYGTFDLTNKAIFKNYPWSYTIADMTWGTLCVGIVSFINFKLITK